MIAFFQSLGLFGWVLIAAFVLCLVYIRQIVWSAFGKDREQFRNGTQVGERPDASHDPGDMT